MEDLLRSNVGMNKEALRKMLEDEEILELQLELLDRLVKGLEEKGYSRDQAISLVSSA